MKNLYFFLIILTFVSCAEKEVVKKPAPVVYQPAPVYYPPVYYPPPSPVYSPPPVARNPAPKEAEVTLGDVVVENPE